MKKLTAVFTFTLLFSQLSLCAWGTKNRLSSVWAQRFNITDDSEKQFLKAVENNENISNALQTIQNPQALLAGARIAAEQGNLVMQAKISSVLKKRFSARS